MVIGMKCRKDTIKSSICTSGYMLWKTRVYSFSCLPFYVKLFSVTCILLKTLQCFLYSCQILDLRVIVSLPAERSFHFWLLLKRKKNRYWETRHQMANAAACHLDRTFFFYFTTFFYLHICACAILFNI